MAVLMGNSFKVFLFVERGVIENDSGVWTQFLAQHVPGPVVDQAGIGCA